MTIKLNPSISENVEDNDLIESPISRELPEEILLLNRWVIHIKGH